jgi:hypothetical protein
MGSKILWFIGILALVAAGVAGSIYLFNAVSHQNDIVTYEVTGDADSIDLSYTDQTGAMQNSIVELPWKNDFGNFSGSEVYLYAHNRGDYGSVTLNIYINRQLFRTATFTGGYNSTSIFGDK